VNRYIQILCLCPLLCMGQTNATEEESLFLNRISDFWEEGEYKIAKSQIQEFLSLYPNSPFADTLCSALGDLFVREKNYSQAIDYYAQIKDPEIASKIFIHRMQCLHSLQWHSILADECEAYLQKERTEKELDLQVTYYLAMALYEQCLNLENDPENLLVLASKAKPYFETLFRSPVKIDVAPAFAHLLKMLKEFEQSAAIYLDLASNNPSSEMLFYAALSQSAYDPELSLKTFEQIEGNQKPQAVFNRLLLLFDLKKYNDLLSEKETFLQEISPSDQPMAHLLFGRSLLLTGNPKEASKELLLYIETQSSQNPSLLSALSAWVDALFEASDLSQLYAALDTIKGFYPDSNLLNQAKLSIALLLQKENEYLKAKELLETADETAEILFTLIQLSKQTNNWICCRQYAQDFLLRYSDHQETPIVQQYLIAASSELATLSDDGKLTLILDLQHLLTKEIAPDVKTSFQTLLAQTLILTNQHEKALPILLEIKNQVNPDKKGLIYLLLSICYKEGIQDLSLFIEYGEKVFLVENTDIDQGSLHKALYMAYLSCNNLEKAQEHLVKAFELKVSIDSNALIWLSQRYANQGMIEQAISVLESQQEIPEFLGPLAKLYSFNNKKGKGISLLERHLNTLSEETLLDLANLYVDQGEIEKAEPILKSLFQDKSALRTFVGASACLQSARLQMKKIQNNPSDIEDPILQNILVQLKNLVLQKNIAFEPIYLEAALDYVNLQGTSVEKKISLLKKMKNDFENQEDILSKDYHLGKEKNEQQKRIHEAYMNLIDAEIDQLTGSLENDLILQKQLQAKAKDLLLRLIEDHTHPELVARANQCQNR
jgi:tetratricopeptide (TPR) repeat protein